MSDMPDRAIEDEYVPTFPLHPFVTLESAMENLQALKVTLGIIGHSEHLPPPKLGTPAYSYAGVEEALCSLFQQLVVMLPEEYERTEGDWPMPDRAVVDDDDVCPLNSPNFPTGHGWGHAGDDGWRDCRCGARAFDPRDVRDPALIERDRQAYEQFLRSQQPRALVALSDDRQWLVVLRPVPADYIWLVYRFHPLTLELIPQRPAIKDTGQDAHQVLAAWLEGRGA